MSFRERTVWTHSRAEGLSLLLLLAIADYGDSAYPSITTLAAKVKISERHAQRLLRRLERLGEVQTNKGGGRGHSNAYRLAYPCLNGDSQVTLSSTNGDSGVTHLNVNGDSQVTLSALKGDIAKSPEVQKKKKRKEAEPLPPIPSCLNTPEFIEAWGMWIADRSARGKPVTRRAAELQLKELSRFSVEAGIRAIHKAISGGWSGLFPKEEADGCRVSSSRKAKEEDIHALIADRRRAEESGQEWPMEKQIELQTKCNELGYK